MEDKKMQETMNQIIEQKKLQERKGELKELEKLSEPLIKFLKKNHNPYCQIIIDMDTVKIVEIKACTNLSN
jgi:hypothetical protein